MKDESGTKVTGVNSLPIDIDIKDGKVCLFGSAFRAAKRGLHTCVEPQNGPRHSCFFL